MALTSGVEKNNDTARRYYQSSNHMNAPKEVIMTEARLQQLASSKREEKIYKKK